jgi:ribosomal protein L32
MTSSSLSEYSKRDGLRDGSVPTPGLDCCPICERPLPSPRARYCTDACRQRAFRLRHQPVASVDVGKFRQDLQRRQTLVAHTLYECSSCGERRLGERRCADCGLFSHALGLAGICPGCDEPILLTESLELE